MRRRLSEREFRRQLAKIKSENTQKERQMALDAEKNKYSKKQFETSKLIAIYLFVLLNGIVIFAMVAMWHFADLSYLGVLITDIAAAGTHLCHLLPQGVSRQKAEREAKV